MATVYTDYGWMGFPSDMEFTEHWLASGNLDSRIFTRALCELRGRIQCLTNVRISCLPNALHCCYPNRSLAICFK
jgi:hypothetical protein